MELCQLRNFTQVAKSDTLTKAAQDLHITQPALSKSIASLEAELGLKLFYRDSRKLKLNRCGEIVLAHTTAFFNLMQDAILRLDDENHNAETNIRVVTTSSPGNPDRLQQIISAFLRENPNVCFSYEIFAIGLLKRMLEHREIDIAITSQDIQDGNIAWKHLYTERIGIVMSVQNPLSRKKNLRLSDFADQNFFLKYANSEERWLTEKLCHLAGFEPKICFAANYAEFALEHIAKNEGITLMERPMEQDQDTFVRACNMDCFLTFRDLEGAQYIRQYGYATLKTRYYTAMTREFMNHLERSFHTIN